MKSLLNNSLYNIMYRCLNVIFPLITAAWVSRILLAEGVGRVSSAQNIVSYFTILAALGLPTYGTKVIAEKNNSRKEQSKVFVELFIINMISTAVCGLVYYAMIFSVPYFQKHIALFVVCGLAIPFNIINVDWFYQGKEEYGYITVRSLIIKIISVVACVSFVKTSEDYIIYALIATLATVMNYIFNIIHLRKFVSIELKDLSVLRHVKPIIIMLVASVAIEIYTLADTTMLTFLCGDTIVGYYTNSMKAVSVVRALVTALCAVFLPRLSYYYAAGQKQEFDKLVNTGIKILALISIPAAVGMAMVVGDFVPVMFGIDFLEAIPTTRILTISIVSVSFSNFFGYQVLVVVGKEKHMMISTIIGAIVNIILNFLLIFLWQHNGAALASVVTELCVAVYQMFAIRGTFKLEVGHKFMLSIFVSTLFMAIVVAFVNCIVSSTFLSLVFAVSFGSLGYIAMLFVTKNELVMQLKGKLGI